MSRFAYLALLGLVSVGLGSHVAAGATSPPKEVKRAALDYRHFRTLAIDLAGRMPTREEVAALEQPDFDLQRWVDDRLAGAGYVQRLTRIYMDLLRLEPNVNFVAPGTQLYREKFLGPDGKPIYVYYRPGQRRAREETDGDLCISPEESGLVARPSGAATGDAKPISAKRLEQYTVLVKPWWLYRDYRAPEPWRRYREGWENPDPEYRPVEGLLTEPDGKPTEQIRVCREEAQTQETGRIYASGRKPSGPPKTPGGRARPAPPDRPYAIAHAGELVSCDSRLAFESSIDCGCGVGLERCMPGDGNGSPAAFYFPNHMPLGSKVALDSTRQQAQRWYPYWWSREAVQQLEYLFGEDRDFREILTGRATWINGPLAQFYRTIQRGGCCGGNESSLGMPQESEPLFDPRNVPPDLQPQDVGTWLLVADRGPHAAGILTTPMFLEKYASARSRGAALYTDFLCKSFVAENAKLEPSTEPNLMVRPGCSTCHASLEPMAAYFARIEPASFVFLPKEIMPVYSHRCRADARGRLNGACNALYDSAFADEQGAVLRSAYASPAHADMEPAGAAREITSNPDFAACAVQQVAGSFLGRALARDDEAWLHSMTEEFVRSGFRMRALVRAIVGSDVYAQSNDVASKVWRDEMTAGSSP